MYACYFKYKENQFLEIFHLCLGLEKPLFTEWAWGNRSSLYNNFVMLMWFGWIGN